MPPEDYIGPRGPQLRDAILDALLLLGDVDDRDGAVSVKKIFDEVVKIERISKEILAVLRDFEKQKEPEVKLLMKGQFDQMTVNDGMKVKKKRFGLLEPLIEQGKRKKGYWKLTEKGKREAIKSRWEREHNESGKWWPPGEWQGEGKIGRPEERQEDDDTLLPEKVTLPEDIALPEEIASQDKDKYYEGACKRIFVNSYERNRKARDKCVEHHGCKCAVCSFDFEKIYGDIGKGRIHVHHKKPLSDVNGEYKVDEIEDLIPVCPNCHMMIHHDPKKPALSIEELKQILKQRT